MNPKDRVLTAPDDDPRVVDAEGDFEADSQNGESGESDEGEAAEGGSADGQPAGEGDASQAGAFDPFRRRRRRRRRRGRGRGPGGLAEGGAPAVAEGVSPEARGRYAVRAEPAAAAHQPHTTVKGIVKLHGDHSGTLVSSETYFAERGDPFLPKFLVESEDLEDGLLVEAEAVSRGPKGPMVQKILAIEGLDPAEYRGKYIQFHKGVSVDPDVRLRMETAPEEISGRVLDLVAPIGRGQRCLIVAPPKAGKTFLLKAMANAIAKNNPDVKIFMLLVDERPEEVTDMQRSITGEVVASPSDLNAAHHIAVSEACFERAKRLVEIGHDVGHRARRPVPLPDEGCDPSAKNAGAGNASAFPFRVRVGFIASIRAVRAQVRVEQEPRELPSLWPVEAHEQPVAFEPEAAEPPVLDGRPELVNRESLKGSSRDGPPEGPRKSSVCFGCRTNVERVGERDSRLDRVKGRIPLGNEGGRIRKE